MERLTKRISGYAYGAEGVSADRLTGDYCRGEFEATACVDKLAEYEDLEERGRFLKLPVPAGSLVYEPYQFMGDGAWEINVHKIRLEDLDKIGKTVFLTREEAEAALERMGEK